MFRKRLFQIFSVGSLTIAACKVAYGMPVDIDYFKAVKVQTKANLPIEGLSVRLILNSDTMSAEFTNIEGVVPFNYNFHEEDSYSVLIEDIDGEENQGNFISKEAELTEPDTTIVQLNK